MFKEFYKDENTKGFSKRSPKRRPRKPAVEVKRKFVHLAEQKFGIFKGRTDTYWPRRFTNKFPLALQTTHDNFKLFLDWFCDNPKYEVASENFSGMQMEFTIKWWEDLGEWFLQVEHREIDPLHLVFNPKSRMGRRWLTKFARDRQISPDRFVKEACYEIARG